MAVQQFDELNTLRSHAETWFSKMAVPEEAKKRRVDLAMDYTLIMLMLFDMITSGKSSKPKETVFLRERLKAVADKYVGTKDTAYINDWSREEAIRIVDETHKQIEEAEKPAEESSDEETPKPEEEKDVIHFDEYDVDIPKAEYPTSDFRGLLIAVECATSVSNYDDFYQAVQKNGATRKVWISEADGRVRATHDEAHGQERPITKLFNVGDSELMFPGDITHGADMKEIYNCRCHVEYIDNNSIKTMDYRKERIEDSETEFDTQGEIIRAKAIAKSPNNIYVSNESNIKPRKLQEIEKTISKHLKTLANDDFVKPTFVIVADKELSMASGGRYNAEHNTLYIKPTVESELQDNIIKHELIHWTDAQKYILEGNVINNNTEYINIMCDRCKPILDKIGINADNVGEISTYAKNMYTIGRYDEVYTEYRTLN